MRSKNARHFRKKHMAWFGNWFSKKSDAAGGYSSDAGLLEQAQTAKSVPAGSRSPAVRKNTRLEQRELLYAVVRESMPRLGLITSSYKYKVLSLDTQGRQYLIMMDLKQDMQSQAPLMSKIEHLLTQEAQSRHGIQISGLYWRFSDYKPLDGHEAATHGAKVKPAGVAAATPAPVNPVKPLAAELADARKALEKVLDKPREQRETAPSAFPDTLFIETQSDSQKHRAAPSAFPDTQLIDHEERVFPLSATQLGTLN